MQEIINDLFDIEINYYVKMNFAAVREIVDSIGGINVIIESDDSRGIYKPSFTAEQGGPLHLSIGSHQIDSQTALRLTRARGSAYNSYRFPQSDFSRNKNQQQIFLATKYKLNWRLALDPLSNRKLFQAVAQNVDTNLQINEIMPLFRLLELIPSDSLQSISLNNIKEQNLLIEYHILTGQDALVPAVGIHNYSTIKAVIREIMKQ